MKKVKKVLITDFDGFNVHNPDSSSEWREFKTLEGARLFASIVKGLGWAKAVELLGMFRRIL